MLKFIFLIFIINLAWSQDEDLSVFEKSLDTEKPAEAMDVQETKNTWKISKRDNSEDNFRESKTLDLRSVIEEGFRRNPFQQIREQRKEQIELNKQDIFQSFWLPQVGLEFQSSSHRLDRLRESPDSNSTMGAQKSPTGQVGLSLGEYTLFNWGRDYLGYLNNKHTLNRNTQQLSEQRRRLKFSLMSQYFNLIRFKEILKIKQEQLRQTSFIHRMAKQKLQRGQIKTQEYYQTRSEYFRSQTEYQQALFEVGLEEEKMANLLGDEYRGNYQTTEQLKFVSVNTSMDEALKLSLDQSVDYRDAKLAFDVANRSYEKTLKDNLPLPKVSLNLGTYTSTYGSSGTAWNYETTSNNKNLELVASINMRWTLIGEGGFFNTRQNQQAYLNKRISEINYYNTRRQLEVKVRTIYKTLRFLEQKVKIAEYQQKNSQSNYDSVLDNYVSTRATYPDIKLAIDNLVNSSINTENVKYEHLLRKLELADYMGLEDFPGENFEQLAVR